jgi:serine/threonine-protein kinase RsbW
MKDGDAVVIDLPSEAGLLGIVRSSLRALAENDPRVRLADREIDEIQVVLQEACTNAIRHAHKCDATKRLRVEMRRLDDGLEILVKDRGAPFDIGGHVASPPEALREGGYGIGIMRSWMDEVSVTRENGGNVLRLVRRYRVSVGDDGVLAG